MTIFRRLRAIGMPLRLSPCLGLMLGLTLALMTGVPPATASAYKWVDEEGNLHYSQTVPPEQSGEPRQRLIPGGVLVDEQPLLPILPEEEAPADAQDDPQQRRDRSLMVYRNAADLVRVRDESLQIIEGEAAMVQTGYQRQMSVLAREVARAAALERSGRAVGADLAGSIENTRQALRNEARKLALIQQRRQALDDRHAADMARWQELKAAEPTTDPASDLATDPSSAPNRPTAAEAGPAAEPMAEPMAEMTTQGVGDEPQG